MENLEENKDGSAFKNQSVMDKTSSHFNNKSSLSLFFKAYLE